jgi:hypothetical protein
VNGGGGGGGDGACEVRAATVGGDSYQNTGKNINISRHNSSNSVLRDMRVTSTRAARQHSNLPKTAKLTRAASTDAPAAALRYSAGGCGACRSKG